MNEVKQYAQRDLMAMDIAGDHYCRHVDHMTREELHSKSDIAAELGWRDMQIASIKAERDKLAAENMALLIQLRNIIDIVSKADNRYCMCGESMDSHSLGGCGSPTGMFDYHFSKLTEENPETPATDAYANQLRAEGVAMVRDEFKKHDEQFKVRCDWFISQLLRAPTDAKLRAGEPS